MQLPIIEFSIRPPLVSRINHLLARTLGQPAPDRTFAAPLRDERRGDGLRERHRGYGPWRGDYRNPGLDEDDGAGRRSPGMRGMMGSGMMGFISQVAHPIRWLPYAAKHGFNRRSHQY